jgi:hypothetical protein
MLAGASSSGLGASPLEFLLGVMRSPFAEPRLRLEAAKAAAPYCHPRMFKGKPGDDAIDAKPIEPPELPPPKLTELEIAEKYGLDSICYEIVVDHHRIRGTTPPSEAEWEASRAKKVYDQRFCQMLRTRLSATAV